MIEGKTAITQNGIDNYIVKINKGEINHYDLPEEYRNHPSIVAIERKLGRRRAVRKGFDIINNTFFVEEAIVISRVRRKIEEKIEKINFLDFESYYTFLQGDIYQNACYYQYIFSKEEIDKFHLDIAEMNFQSLVSTTIDDFSLGRTKEETKNYKKIEKSKKLRKEWINRFNACENYQEFTKVLREFEKGKFRDEQDFFLYCFLSSSNQHAIDIVMELASNNDYLYNIEKALCVLDDPQKIASLYHYNCGSKSSRRERIKEFNKYIELVEKKEIRCRARSFFDERTHFYYYRIRMEAIKGNFYPIEYFKIFETFEEFAAYLNNKISYCDLSKAIMPNIDFSQYTLGEYVKLPIEHYSKLSYSYTKYYDRYKKIFVVEQTWKDEQDQIIKKYTHKFEYFFDFLHFCKNDLSNADLLFCDGISNMQDYSEINLENARLRSAVLDRLSLQYSISEYCEKNVHNFSLISKNEAISKDIFLNTRNIYDPEYKLKKIFYITDLHLLHRIQAESCKTEYDVFYTIQILIDKLLVEVPYGENILLFGGDISSEFKLYCLFVKILRKTLDERKMRAKVIFTLGNHELWEFPHESFDAIVEMYSAFLAENNMFLLQNNILYLDENREIQCINAADILSMTKIEIRNKIIRARIVLFGGLAFSGYNADFNANNGVYGNTINRDDEIEQTKYFEKLYNKICEYMPDKKFIILTHMPMQSWSRNPVPCKGFVYVSGHTHQNCYSGGGEYRLYADNQVGYYGRSYRLKFFYLEDEFDIFSEYKDGIYEISREEYIAFYRGKKIRMTFDREINKLYMLKKNGYYCFFHQSPNGNLSIMNGGCFKGVKVRDIWYYYDKMNDIINSLIKPLTTYTKVQKKIASEVKAFGGSGIIHGCIVDIDYFNHLYVNPFDFSVIPYWAADIIYKKVYGSLKKLLESNCPTLYTNYMKMLGNGLKTDLMTIEDHKENQDISSFYLDTDIYAASREIKKLQKLHSNILTNWIEIPEKLLQGSKKKIRNDFYV